MPRSVRLFGRLSVPWRSCHRCAAALRYRHAGCLQLSVGGLRTHLRTDVDPPRVELPSAGAYRLAAPESIDCFTHIETGDHPRFICLFVRSTIEVRPTALPSPRALDSAAPRRTPRHACSQLMTSQQNPTATAINYYS